MLKRTATNFGSTNIFKLQQGFWIQQSHYNANHRVKIGYGSSFLKSILFTFIEQIGLGTSQINNLGTPITIFFLLSAFFAIVSIRYPDSTTYYTPSLEWSIVALITHTDKGAWANIRVTDDTLPITFLTQTADGYPWLLPTHDEIRMMLGHDPLITQKFIYYSQSGRSNLPSHTCWFKTSQP